MLPVSSPGRSLRQLLAEGLPLARLLGVVAAVCERLAAAHARGESHGDLSADQVLVDDDEVTLLGWNGHPADPAGDVYAVGELLADCLESGPAPPALTALSRSLRERQDQVRLLDVKAALEPYIGGVSLSSPTTPGAVAPAPARGGLRVVDPSCYEVHGPIAQGGLGKILRARDTRLDRTVAVKELVHEDVTTHNRFLREALLTARLQHPSIVPLYEAGFWPNGEPFYAMKLVSGKPLSEVFAATRGLADRLALLPHLIAAAEAIAYAHSRRIIHRDLKPANVLVGEFGETVVIDWGLAKDLADRDDVADEVTAHPYRQHAGSELTVVGSVLGTPAYMPPEQAAAQPADPRADVYSLGAILYHLLGGRPPYQGGSPQEILDQVTAGPPRPLREVTPGVPADLLAIVDKACARAAAARYPSAQELCEDLKKFQTGQLVGAHEYTAAERLRRFLRRNRTAVAVAAAALAILIAGTALSFRRILAAQRVASARADDLALISARALVDREPRRALAVLAGLSPGFDHWGAARVLASEALGRSEPLVIHGAQPIESWGYMSADLSSDGKLLAWAGRDRDLRLVDLAGGGTRLLPGPAKKVYEVHFSPDGKTLAAGAADGTLLLWDVACLAGGPPAGCLTTFADPQGGYSGAHYPLAFSPDGRLLAWGVLRETVQILAVAEKRRAALLLSPPRGRYPHEGTFSLVFSPDGKTLAATYLDGLTKLWDVAGLGGAAEQTLERPRAVVAEKAFVRGFTPEGLLVTSDGAPGRATFTLRDPGSGAARSTLDLGTESAGLSFSPDGRRLIYAGDDEKLRVLDRAGGERAVLAGHENQLFALAQSADGRRAVTGSADRTVRVWDLETGQSRWVTSHEGVVIHVMISADGGVVASGSLDDTLHVSRIVPQERARLDGIDDDPVYDLVSVYRPVTFALTPDGGRLAWIGRGRSVHLRELHGGATRDLGVLTSPGTSVAVAPDGGRVAAGENDGRVHVWPAAGGAETVFHGTPGHVVALAFSPDGRTLAWGGVDGVLHVVDLASGAVRRKAAHLGWVTRLAFDPEGRRLASGGADCDVRIWDLADLDAAPRVIRNASAGRNGDWPWRVSFAEGGKLLYTKGNAAVRIFDLASGAMQEIIQPNMQTGDGALSPDASLVASGGSDNTIRIWDRRRGAVLRAFGGHSSTILAVAWSPDGGTLASGDFRGQVRLWDVASGESRILVGHGRDVYRLEFTADGDTLVSASRDGTVRLWDDSLPRRPQPLRETIAAGAR